MSRVAIVFESHTGTTAAAAELMAEVVRKAGHECTVTSIHDAEKTRVAGADALCIGTWTKGWFIIGQHPAEGTMAFISDLSLNGKPVAVFATYKLAAGGTLRQMANAVESAGGKVTGMYKVKGAKVPDGFEGWVRSIESAA